MISKTIGFFSAEARLFHGGPPAFFVDLAKTLNREMALDGGIKPFSYECEPWGLGSFKLTVSEAPGKVRTDAARALVKARARTRKRR